MIKTIIFLALGLLFVSACSDEDKGTSENKPGGDHVWKEQTQAIDKTKEVEGLLKDISEQQRKIIDEQAQ